MKCNLNKPYGVIAGHPIYKYEQDEKYFDANFEEIKPSKEEIKPSKEEKKIEEKKKKIEEKK